MLLLMKFFCLVIMTFGHLSFIWFTRDASRAEVLKQMSTLVGFEPLAYSLHANLYHSP